MESKLSKKELDLFKHRDDFDLIVFYDQDSVIISKTNLKNLINSIYNTKYTRESKKPPLLLHGGFNAWKHMYGNVGIEHTVNDNNQDNDNLAVNGKNHNPRARMINYDKSKRNGIVVPDDSLSLADHINQQRY